MLYEVKVLFIFMTVLWPHNNIRKQLCFITSNYNKNINNVERITRQLCCLDTRHLYTDIYKYQR